MLNTIITDPFFPECPVRNVLARLGNKWSLLVLLTLDEAAAPMRYKEIRSHIPDISQKMLTLTLRELEADGMLSRKAYAEIPPRVEYALTPRAETLLPHLKALVDWALGNFNGIMADRQHFHTSQHRD